ncbi:MAG: hypothetical protein CVU97_07535 [Firmicutes bacterium HGW-Firmicutes-21]|nr:MAG: hypothetical protein CVU97_07535 [Firmicutes bacterium HGW-Firmicutes-21]
MDFCKPNLPLKAREIFVSSLIPNNIINELIKLGTIPVKLGRSSRICSELAFHPDILTLNYANGKWLVADDESYFPINMNNMLTRVKYNLSDMYPDDCIFNSFIIGSNIFCGRRNEEHYKNIDVLQGFSTVCFKQCYTKCSVIVLNECSFITSDRAIEKKLKQLQYDCLYVTNNGIALNGFSCGFIGGCAGKIAYNQLVFTGNIKEHTDYNSIKSFCGNHGIDIYSLSKQPLYDYGGLLPVTEQ